MDNTEEQQFVSTMNDLGIKFHKWTGKNYIYSTAVSLGAVVEYEVKGARFCFDGEGTLVGTANDSINSFSPKGRKECIRDVK